jgi:hypothetical protein
MEGVGLTNYEHDDYILNTKLIFDPHSPHVIPILFVCSTLEDQVDFLNLIIVF